MDVVPPTVAAGGLASLWVVGFWALMAAVLVPLTLLAVLGHIFADRSVLALYAAVAVGAAGTAAWLAARGRLRCDAAWSWWEMDWLVIGAVAGAGAGFGAALAWSVDLQLRSTAGPALTPAERLLALAVTTALALLVGTPVLGALEVAVVAVLSLLHLRVARRRICGPG